MSGYTKEAERLIIDQIAAKFVSGNNAPVDSVRITADEWSDVKAEIERLTSSLRYEQHRAERIGTHGPGCEMWGPAHYECAMQEIEKLQHSLADYEETNEKYLARIVWFDGQLAASRRELVGASKSARAQARIIESLRQQRAQLYAQRDQWIEARDTLDSERAANARLTEELAASREREARMRDALGAQK